MAHIIPEGWQVLEAAAASRREIETLALLAATLSDACTVHHGMHWTRQPESRIGGRDRLRHHQPRW
jgi:hypothetical protein